jgi:hypothetical protein
MAIATALVAIVLIGALIAGTFFFAAQDYRVGRTSLDTDRALTAAEYGQTTALKDWTAAVWNQNRKIGDTLKRVYATGGSSTDTVTVTRIKYNMFWVVSSGRSESGTVSSEGRRRTGFLVRMNTPVWPIPGAFTGANTVDLSGNYTGDGADNIPAGWTDCPPAVDPIAAVASVSTANISGAGGCAGNACLSGANPVTKGTPDAADQTKILDGWNELTAQADKIFNASGSPIAGTAPSYNADGSCKTTDNKNWGDPGRVASPGVAGQCENYFPIVWIKSTVQGALGTTQTVNSGGKGQGIMLVEGNLTISGGFEWTGPIIVKGNVSTSGNGNKVTGAIQALNIGCVSTAATKCNNLAGTSSINYSNCALDKILSLKAVPASARHHAWAEMF